MYFETTDFTTSLSFALAVADDVSRNFQPGSMKTGEKCPPSTIDSLIGEGRYVFGRNPKHVRNFNKTTEIVESKAWLREQRKFARANFRYRVCTNVGEGERERGKKRAVDFRRAAEGSAWKEMKGETEEKKVEREKEI